jgi:HEAT repeat protein
VRRAAISHLAAMPGPAATLALTSLLAEPRAREDVACALSSTDGARATALLTALETASEEVAPILVRLLGLSADPIVAIEAALTSSGPPGRRAAAAALAELGAPRSRGALARALAEDTDPEVRQIASIALGR